ncbi:hypothetical protein [Corynebacterium sp.]|uniref:hypothetical protein n=1 Tax=Corynebacterium sp. TaxID=1720 RepID=UPI0026DC1387|nr:hypothetical protein [Corynebacterium sp.]MDO5032358.1 hypothetical protein [Corynebacterium sp.]
MANNTSTTPTRYGQAQERSEPRDRIELSVADAHAIVEAVSALPGVASLYGGRFGEVAALYPGERVAGISRPNVRDDSHLSVHIVVDVDADIPLYELAESVRGAVATAWPAVRIIDVTLADATSSSAQRTPTEGQS